MTPGSFVSNESPAATAGRSWSLWRWSLAGLWIVFIVLFAQSIAASGMVDERSAYILALLDFGPWIFLTPAIFWVVRRAPIGAATWRWAIPLHVLTCGVIAVASEFLVALAHRQEWLRPPSFGPMDADFHRPPTRARPPMPPPPMSEELPAGPPPGVSRAFMVVPIYVVLAAIAHAAAHARSSSERERRALQAEAQLAEARLLALQTQLQPHFLFNTLNSIASLVHTQPAAADRMICSLSALLRGVLDIAHEREVPLASEIALIRQYLEIQSIRFEGRLRVVWAVSPGIERCVIPTLLLQPLVENAIIHGIAPLPRGGSVTIRATAEGDSLIMVIEDDGKGLDPAQSERVGLRGTRERLQTLYHGRASFTLAPRPAGGTVARVSLPRRESASVASLPDNAQ